MIDNEIDRMLLMLVPMFYVGSIVESNIDCQYIPVHMPIRSNKERLFIPALKGRGFLARSL
jgi:hypothetical protein